MFTITSTCSVATRSRSRNRSPAASYDPSETPQIPAFNPVFCSIAPETPARAGPVTIRSTGARRGCAPRTRQRCIVAGGYPRWHSFTQIFFRQLTPISRAESLHCSRCGAVRKLLKREASRHAPSVLWGSLMRRMTISVFLNLVSLVGCAHLNPASSRAAPTGAAVVAPQTVAAETTAAQPPAGSVGGSIASTTEIMAGGSGPAKAKSPSANSSVKLPAPDASTTQAPTQATIAKVAEKAADKPAVPPTLDLASLEQRLRDTHAIGVFTKLSLKNQVDDLLDQFRAYHRGENKNPLAELRQRFNLLLLKVLTLLQDSDAPLAAAISSSREAIWAILTDPDKFAKI